MVSYMKKYYVFDSENEYRIILNFTCYTNDIQKYIFSHKCGIIKNLREISKKEYSSLQKQFKCTYKF